MSDSAGHVLERTSPRAARTRSEAAPAYVLRLNPTADIGLQDQIRQKLIDAILSGVFRPGQRLPSSRLLARQLGVARNTVVLACQQLIADGYITTRERSGLFVGEIAKGRLDSVGGPDASAAPTAWQHRFKRKLDDRDHAIPPDWRKYPYPFLEGRFDNSLFPLAEWREANRLSLSAREVHHWATDLGEADDAMLLAEICAKVLPRRGIRAQPNEILITAGTRQALHLITELFVDAGTSVALEEPGNPAMYQLVRGKTAKIHHQPVDADGIVVDEALDGRDLVYVTPSHQRPTAATLSMARRHALLEKAATRDLIVVEDDFECETNYLDDAYPALRSLPGGERVVYVASLSRVLSSGLRLGFIVASPEIIGELRRLRSLVSRHPPLNNQRATALFISLGHYDATMLRIGRVLRERLIALRDALNFYLPDSIAFSPVQGGTTFWVNGPADLDARDLARAVEARGVLIEPVDRYYAAGNPPRHIFRVGVTGIPVERIRSGVSALAEVFREIAVGAVPRREFDKVNCLQGDALRRAISGASFLFKTVYGDPCTIEILRNGRLVGNCGYANEDRDQGRWWLQDDRWFRHWDEWAYGEPSGYYIEIEGDRVLWHNVEGRMVGSAIYVPPTANGS